MPYRFFGYNIVVAIYSKSLYNYCGSTIRKKEVTVVAEEVKKKQSNIALTALIVGAILLGAAAMSAATLALINSQNSNL